MDELRAACAAVAARARHVTVDHDALPAYVVHLAAARQRLSAPPPAEPPDLEATAATALTLDAINFGSGWFPTLRKRGALSGYNTIAASWREHPAPTARELTQLTPQDVAAILHQDPGHELMALYAGSLNNLGAHVTANHDGSFTALADIGATSAVNLARHLGSLPCFADTSRYDELTVPFLKRAQIAATDLARAGVISPPDLSQLTMFADNLVPHVLRLDGILTFDPALVRRIDNQQLIEHGSSEEVEIRACALHAVELIVAGLHDGPGPRVTAAAVDELLWNRGQQPSYKAAPRHRARCTAY
jgi:hypothetical protein